jgi:hypothetical protein
MNAIRPIRSARDHRAALAAIDILLAAEKPTKEQDERLEVLTVLVNETAGGDRRTWPRWSAAPWHLSS